MSSYVTEAKFLVSDWENIVYYDIELSYRAARLLRLRAGTTTLHHSRLYPPVRDKEFGLLAMRMNMIPFMQQKYLVTRGR
jgi:hypothetical protein